MMVAIEQPQILSLLYRQEKGDPDYGSCLWARFYLDLNNYTMAIESDCGNYTYGWVPTPKSESFLQLLARMNGDYLLGKISSQTVIDGDETFKQIKELVEDLVEATFIELPDYIYPDIEECCHQHNDERDLVADVLDASMASALYRELEPHTSELYGCVAKDYPTSAKKIAEVFVSCIKPKIKEIIDGTVTMLSIVGSDKEED